MVLVQSIVRLKLFRVLFVVFLLIEGANVFAQYPSELWHEGKVVLESGDTLRGMIKYDFQQDLVQYALKDQTAEVFTARKVLFFEIYEVAIHQYRRFFALPYATQTGYKAPIFFELLEEGKMTLLAREFLEYKSYRSMYFGMYTKLVLSYRYYFLNEKGEITEFNGTRNDLVQLMGKKADAVETYMRKNHLRTDERSDLVQIIDYYNSLF
jgi:hypothetical protein